MAEWWNVTRKNWQRAKLPVLMKCEKGKELAKLFNQVDQPFSSQHKKKHMKRILKHNFFLFFCLFGDMYFCVLGDMYFCLLRDMYCSACKSISIITRLQSLWPCQQNINERTEYQQNINRMSTEYQWEDSCWVGIRILPFNTRNFMSLFPNFRMRMLWVE